MRSIEDQLGPSLAGLQRKLEGMRLRDQQTQKELEKLLKPVLSTAKKLVPKPGYPGDKPQYKPLRDTLKVASRTMRPGSTWYGMVGPQYPAGAHGHLVEGWRQPRRSPAMTTTPFIEPAFVAHKQQLIQRTGVYVGRSMARAAKRGR
jgi:hypothetical protein